MADEPRTDTADAEGAAVYVISVAAELAGMHPQTLRMYERKGLLRPQRTAGNTRRYSRRDITRLQRIQHLTQVEGMNLAGVRVVMDLLEQLEAAQCRIATLEARLVQLKAEGEDAVAEVRRSYRRDLVPYDPPAQLVAVQRRRRV